MTDKSNPSVQQLQTFIKNVKPLGIGYALPADGVMTPQFEAVLNYLQSALAGAGHKVSLQGSNALSELQKVMEKIDPSSKVETQEKKVEEGKPATSELPEVQSLDKKDEEPSEQSTQNAAWEGFLSESLPVVGKLYDGDIEQAAKNLEAAIGKEIGKSMSGVIWNDSKKTFNTTPDDIRNALEKIQTHRENKVKGAEIKQDERVLKYADLLRRWAIEKK